MSSLGDVPPEILTNIASEVLPGDIVNFAVVCKAFANAATKALEQHRHFNVLYETLYLTLRTSAVSPWSDDVRVVLKDPRKAFYVRAVQVNVPRRWPHINARPYAEDLIFEIQKEIVHELEKSSELANAVSSIDFTNWPLGDQHAFIKMASLLFVLPNVVKFECGMGLRMDSGVVKMYQALISLLAAMGEANAEYACAKPSWLKLTPQDNSNFIPAHDLIRAMSIPSLRGINAGVTDGHIPVDLIPRTSDVKYLKLIGCPKSQLQTYHILAYPKRLQAFCCYWAPATSLSPYDLCSSLLRYVGHSLRYLTIRNYETNSHYLGPLHQFKSLIYLDTDFTLLFETIPVTTELARKMVPRTLRQLILHEDPNTVTEEAISALCDLLVKKRHVCPHLVCLTVYFDTILDDYDPEAGDHVEAYGYRHEEALKTICDTQSIQFKAHYVDTPQYAE